MQRVTASPTGLTTSRRRRGSARAGDSAPRCRPGVDDRPDYLRDDVAGPLDDHPVTDADVLAVDLVLVVEAGVGDLHPADVDRLEGGDRREGPGATDLRLDVDDPRGLAAGLELPGQRPTRVGGAGAERLVPGQAIDLEHASVDLVRQVVAALGHLGEPGGGFVRVVQTDRLLVRDQPSSRRRCRQAHWVSGRSLLDGAISQKKMRSGRRALTCGSSCRRLPAAALRGFAKGASPSSSRRSFSSRKPGLVMYTSPRTTRCDGRVVALLRSQASGTSAIVRTFSVTSSPVRPSPRVAAVVRRPSS